MKIIRTEEFASWLKNLRNAVAKAKITRFLERAATEGLSGDIKPVGEGVSEARFNTGPGYRVYFVQRGEEVIVVLGGGDKSTQDHDIKAAKSLASKLED